MIYNPTFLKIKQLIAPSILEYVERYGDVRAISIHTHIAKLKKEHPATYKLIDFDYSYTSAYSEEVAEVLTDLVRDCHLQETDEGYKLR